MWWVGEERQKIEEKERKEQQIPKQLKFSVDQCLKAQRGTDAKLYSSFKLCDKWGVWSAPRPDRFTPRERPSTHFIGGWVDNTDGLDGCGKNRPPLGFDRRTFRPVASRYSGRDIPAHKYTHTKGKRPLLW
jgi:hypothetical protein